MSKKIFDKLKNNEINEFEFDYNEKQIITNWIYNNELLNKYHKDENIIIVNDWLEDFNEYDFHCDVSGEEWIEPIIKSYIFMTLCKNLKINTSLTSLKINNFNMFIYEDNFNNTYNLFEILKNKSSLTELNLSDNIFSKNDILYLQEILKNNSLTSLNLSSEHNYFNLNENMYKFFENLKYNSSLTSLNLSNNKLININKLGECLKYNTSLTELNLRDNKIKNIDELGECLKYNTSLTSLNLSNNEIIDINELGECLKYNTSLTELNLSNNEITNINKLCEYLKYNTNLYDLNIGKNNLSWDTLENILKNNSFLTSLNFENNSCDYDFNLNNICEYLKNNSSLTSLNLSNNNLCDDILSDLINKGLKYNNSLTELNLKGNDITIKELITYLNSNSSLIKLNLDNILYNKFDYNINDDEIDEFFKVLNKNSSLTSLSFLNNLNLKDKTYFLKNFNENLKDNITLTDLNF